MLFGPGTSRIQFLVPIGQKLDTLVMIQTKFGLDIGQVSNKIFEKDTLKEPVSSPGPWWAIKRVRSTLTISMYWRLLKI